MVVYVAFKMDSESKFVIHGQFDKKVHLEELKDWIENKCIELYMGCRIRYTRHIIFHEVHKKEKDQQIDAVHYMTLTKTKRTGPVLYDYNIDGFSRLEQLFRSRAYKDIYLKFSHTSTW